MTASLLWGRAEAAGRRSSSGYCRCLEPAEAASSPLCLLTTGPDILPPPHLAQCQAEAGSLGTAPSGRTTRLLATPLLAFPQFPGNSKNHKASAILLTSETKLEGRVFYHSRAALFNPELTRLGPAVLQECHSINARIHSTPMDAFSASGTVPNPGLLSRQKTLQGPAW